MDVVNQIEFLFFVLRRRRKVCAASSAAAQLLVFIPALVRSFVRALAPAPLFVSSSNSRLYDEFRDGGGTGGRLKSNRPNKVSLRGSEVPPPSTASVHSSAMSE